MTRIVISRSRRRREWTIGGSRESADGAGGYWDSVPATMRERIVWDQTWAEAKLERCLEVIRRTEPGR